MLDIINLENIQNQPNILINTLKTIFVIVCVYYTNFKIINSKRSTGIKALFEFILVLLGAVICGIIKCKSNDWIGLGLSILIISVIFSKNNILNGALTTITSYAINYVISFMTILLSFIINIVIKIDNHYINLGIIIFFHILFLYRLFKTRRIKYGIKFLQRGMENEFLNMIMLNICVILIVLIIIMANANNNIIIARELLLTLIISIAIMFITIQKSLQLYYKQKLLEKDLNETKEELANKIKEVEELEAENLSISKKSHTLTHKQKSLEYKLEELMNKTEISKEEAAEVRERLKEIEKDLYKEKNTVKLDKTGIAQIDDMLEYMQSECKKNKIDFELQINGNIYYMTNNLIPKEDLETLLADHIKNAIIAINHTENINRSILVRLGEIDGIYSVYIYDSGIEFEKETLENLGKKPSTTHENEGGTGMGFMNTFDTLRKCEASLIINEFNEPSKDNYTKAIIIKFDKKNEFKIISYR